MLGILDEALSSMSLQASSDSMATLKLGMRYYSCVVGHHMGVDSGVCGGMWCVFMCLCYFIYVYVLIICMCKPLSQKLAADCSIGACDGPHGFGERSWKVSRLATGNVAINSSACFLFFLVLLASEWNNFVNAQFFDKLHTKFYLKRTSKWRSVSCMP